jgi:ATP-dependent DNA ligase
MAAETLATPVSAENAMSLEVSADLVRMDARLVMELPAGPGWRFEPKWDGFRCLAFKDGPAVVMRSKSGKSLERFFPEIVSAILALPQARFALDGELTIRIEGRTAFDALQARLHPAASRIARLAQETPADFIAFDCLADDQGVGLVEACLERRLAVLRRLAQDWPRGARVRLGAGTLDLATATAWLDRTGAAIDGVVAKRLADPYTPGERSLLKVKRLRSADCVVGGFRREKDSPLVASLLLGLYDADHRLNHVGFTAAISDAERPALTARLDRLAGGAGFTGKAPGGPSRWTRDRSAEWTPLRPELVVEVGYDQVTGARLRHGARLLRWRPDKAPEQCRMEQLEPERSPLDVIPGMGEP